MDAPNDPFLEKFFSRIPSATAATFTPAQLAAIRMAFGARSWGSHAIDIRKSFPFFRRRLYFVLLIGGERRTAARLRAEGELFGTFGNAIVTLVFIALLIAPLIVGFYLLKTVAGVDLVPGGGTHGVLDDITQQLRQMGR